MTHRAVLGHCLVALIAIGPVVTADAQSVSQPALTAAFLFNFTKFTEWPLDKLPARSALEICVADARVADALEVTIARQSIGDHEVVVTRIKIEDDLRSCEVVYASGLDARQTGQLVESVRGASVLTVGDMPKFIETGGIVRLYLEKGRMRFAINITAAGRAKLHLRSQLLTLATIVKDVRP